MLKIIEIIKYTIPLYGNKQINPYGKIIISDGDILKIVKFENYSFNYKRKKYYIENINSLYNPIFIVKE